MRYPTQSEKFDYAIELVAVIGRRARRLTLNSALECVAGETIALDLSARDRLETASV